MSARNFIDMMGGAFGKWLVVNRPKDAPRMLDIFGRRVPFVIARVSRAVRGGIGIFRAVVLSAIGCPGRRKSGAPLLVSLGFAGAWRRISGNVAIAGRRIYSQRASDRPVRDLRLELFDALDEKPAQAFGWAWHSWHFWHFWRSAKADGPEKHEPGPQSHCRADGKPVGRAAKEQSAAGK